MILNIHISTIYLIKIVSVFLFERPQNVLKSFCNKRNKMNINIIVTLPKVGIPEGV